MRHQARPAGAVNFGAFEVDLRAGELRKHGIKIKLQDQPFQILALLLERPGEVVTREELRLKLWPGDTFVDFDHGLNNAINRLREALGDAADTPRFIETLPRRGYRFIAPVHDGAATPSQTAPPTSPVRVAVEPPAAEIEPATTGPQAAGARPRRGKLWFGVLDVRRRERRRS